MTRPAGSSREIAGGRTDPPSCGVTGIILAGGESSRMGSDKAMLRLGGRTFLERLCDTLSGVAGEVMISASDPGMYAGAGPRVVGDVFRRCGPLGGIHAALSAISTPRAFVVSCDMPLARPGAFLKLLSVESRGDAVIAACGGRLQPLFGLYHKKILPELEEALRQGRYSVLGFLAGVNTTAVDPGPCAGLANVNTPGDYAELLSAAGAYFTTAPSPLS